MSVEETVEMMIVILKKETELEIEIEKELRPDTLIEEIGLDSLDVINFLFLLGQKTGVEVQDDILLSDEINKIADLAAYVDRNRS